MNGSKERKAGLDLLFSVDLEEDWLVEWSDSTELNRTMKYVFESGGKRIRPRMCLELCKQFGGSLEKTEIYAKSIETLHNYTLIHDDIHDGDTERRDQETVWKRFGKPVAIQAGDAMQATSYSYLIENSDKFEKEEFRALLEELNRADREVADGQIMDISFGERGSISREEYMEMVEKKTGALFEASLAGAAVISDRHELEEPFRKYSRKMAAAFQIRDDLIDLEGGKGREDARDIAEGKRSLVVIEAFKQLSDDDARELRRILDTEREKTSEKQIDRALELIEKTEAMESSQKVAEEKISGALDVLDSVGNEGEVESLRDITEFMIDRKF